MNNKPLSWTRKYKIITTLLLPLGHISIIGKTWFAAKLNGVHPLGVVSQRMRTSELNVVLKKSCFYSSNITRVLLLHLNIKYKIVEASRHSKHGARLLASEGCTGGMSHYAEPLKRQKDLPTQEQACEVTANPLGPQDRLPERPDPWRACRENIAGPVDKWLNG